MMNVQSLNRGTVLTWALTPQVPARPLVQTQTADTMRFGSGSGDKRNRIALAFLAGVGVLGGLGAWQYLQHRHDPQVIARQQIIEQKNQLVSSVRSLIKENSALIQQVRQETEGKELKPGTPEYQHYEDLLLNNVRNNVHKLIPQVVTVLHSPEFAKSLDKLTTEHQWPKDLTEDCKAMAKQVTESDLKAFVTNERLKYMFENARIVPSPEDSNFISRTVECFLEGATRLAQAQNQPEPVTPENLFKTIVILEMMQDHLGIEEIE